MDERQNTIRSTGLVFAATIVVNAANFGFNFGAIHLIGLRSYSAVAALLAIILVLSVPANVIQAVSATLVGEVDAASESSAATLSKVITLRAFIVSAGVVLAGLFVMAPVASFLSIRSPMPVMAAFLSIAFGLSTAALRGALQGQQRFGAFSWSLVIEAVGNVVYGLGFIAIFHTVAAAMFGNVCAVGSALVFSAIIVLTRKCGERPAIDLKRAAVKCIGATGALGALAAMSWADILLVRHFAPDTYAGLYGALSILGKIVLFSVSFIPFVLLARASKLHRQGHPTRPLMSAMLAVGATLCLVDLLGVKLFPVNILLLVGGPAAVTAAPYAGGYALALACLAMTTIIANYGIAIHRFLFVPPLVAVEAGEITAISLYHPSLHAVILVVLIGHAAALFLVGGIVMAAPRLVPGPTPLAAKQ